MGLFSGISGGDWLRLGTDLLGGALANRSANKALDAQSAAAQEANALQKYMYDTTRADYAPFREAGYTALGQLQNLLQNPGQVRQDPGYMFQRNEGMRALNANAAARGMTYSGAQAKALQSFGNDYATTKLNESYNRLASIAGIGQQATGSVANAGQNYAGNVGNNLIGMGNAGAAAALMRGSTYQNMLGSLGALNWGSQRRPMDTRPTSAFTNDPYVYPGSF